MSSPPIRFCRQGIVWPEQRVAARVRNLIVPPFLVQAHGDGMQTVKLTGLTNGSATYVSIRAVDWAGNEGGAPSLPLDVVLQPNLVSPDFVTEVPLAFDVPRRLAVQGSRLYAFGSSRSPAGDHLQVFDLGTMASAPLREHNWSMISRARASLAWT